MLARTTPARRRSIARPNGPLLYAPEHDPEKWVPVFG
jgi:hypothetical protein